MTTRDLKPGDLVQLQEHVSVRPRTVRIIREDKPGSGWWLVESKDGTRVVCPAYHLFAGVPVRYPPRGETAKSGRYTPTEPPN